MELSGVSIHRIRGLWLLISAALLFWYLYWIFYDALVWGKSLSQINSLNYVGIVGSFILIAGGFRLNKPVAKSNATILNIQTDNKSTNENKSFGSIETNSNKTNVQQSLFSGEPRKEGIILEETLVATMPAEDLHQKNSKELEDGQRRIQALKEELANLKSKYQVPSSMKTNQHC